MDFQGLSQSVRSWWTKVSTDLNARAVLEHDPLRGVDAREGHTPIRQQRRREVVAARLTHQHRHQHQHAVRSTRAGSRRPGSSVPLADRLAGRLGRTRNAVRAVAAERRDVTPRLGVEEPRVGLAREPEHVRLRVHGTQLRRQQRGLRRAVRQTAPRSAAGRSLLAHRLLPLASSCTF